jgi:hypothetical protein
MVKPSAKVPAGSSLLSPGDVKMGHTTVATATECVQVTTETYAPNGIAFEVKDSATYYISAHETAGTDLSGKGLVCKANNGVFIQCDDPSVLFVDSGGSSKTISWCIM